MHRRCSLASAGIALAVPLGLALIGLSAPAPPVRTTAAPAAQVATAPVATTIPPRWTADALDAVDGMHETPAVIGPAIIVPTSSGITALDADTGKRVWSVNRVANAVAARTIVYANRRSEPPSLDSDALIAIDARDGHQLWSKPGAAGALGADDAGVVVGNQHGVTRFAPDGKPRWNLATVGGYHRVIVNDRHVVALSVRSGAIMHGEIESIERRTGRLIGTGALGDLLEIDAQRAQGEGDFPHDFDTWCGNAELLDVSLDSADARQRGILAEQRTNYVLEDIAIGTPPPAAIAYESSTPCKGPRWGYPGIILDGSHVVLASGATLGLFDRTSPGAPFARYRDATFIGGPFAGRLYVARPHGLDTLTIGDRHSPRFDPLVVEPGATFAVAGLGDRLYVSDDKTTTAFDDRTFAKRADYRVGCAHLTALARTKLVDVLECDRSGGGQILALPR